MYATTRARLVCVANYSEFGSAQLSGRVFSEAAPGGAELLLVDEFKPGNISPRVRDAFVNVLQYGGSAADDTFDLLCDVSSSMPRHGLARAAAALVDARLVPLHTFTFDTGLEEVPGVIPEQWPTGGGTDVAAALTQYVAFDGRTPSRKVLILTAADGVRQCREVMDATTFSALDIRCLAADGEVDISSIRAWARRRLT